MSEDISKKRAAMPDGTAGVLDARSLERSNANLLSVLKPGQAVLDVGCGSGSITRGICDYTGKSGQVVGIDRSEALIQQASAAYSGRRAGCCVCSIMIILL